MLRCNFHRKLYPHLNPCGFIIIMSSVTSLHTIDIGDKTAQYTAHMTIWQVIHTMQTLSNNIFSNTALKKIIRWDGHPYSKKMPLEYCWQIFTELDSRWKCRACPASNGCTRIAWGVWQVSAVIPRGQTSWWLAGVAYTLDSTYNN